MSSPTTEDAGGDPCDRDAGGDPHDRDARGDPHDRDARGDPHDVDACGVRADARFHELYAEAAPALFAWAELRIRPPLRARLDPQDLLQEVWLRARRGFAGFDPQTSFRAWAFRIGKNVLLESLRASQRERAADPTPQGPLLALDGIPQSVTSITQRISREDSVRSFLEHARALDEVDRMLLVRCGLEEETCARAAVELGLGEDAAIKRWQRLRARLREAPWARALLGPA